MLHRPFPLFGSKNAPKTPTEFLRAVLPAMLDRQPLTSVAILSEAKLLLADTYRSEKWSAGIARDINAKTVATVLAKPRSSKQTLLFVQNEGKRGAATWRNVDGEPVKAADPVEAKEPPPAKEPPKPADVPMPPLPPSTDKDPAPGLCQATGTLWQDPPAKCVWGACATMTKHERSFLVEAIKASVPDLHNPISASRIRRQAMVINPSVRRLSRANVGAILIFLMREGFSSLIARHNPKRKRRVLYLWHRSVM